MSIIRVFLALVMSALVVIGAASAQDYSVRVTHNTNLRAAASLQARIVETAPAGATLPVMGSAGRWLQINRNGNQVWMASWVRHERVADSAPTQTQTAAPIDNCCFIDRQCTTDQQWTDGYWAFQNGQCAAPAQTRPQVSTQPVDNAPENLDNCCFLDWQCHNDDDWSRGFHAFRNNQCKHPGVKINGSQTFIAFVEASLDLLKSRVPQWYEYAISGLREIKEIPAGRPIGILIDTYTFVYATNYVNDSERSILFMAGAIVHEACHAHKWNEGSATVGWANEQPCYERQLAVTEIIDPDDRHGLGEWIRGIIERAI